MKSTGLFVLCMLTLIACGNAGNIVGTWADTSQGMTRTFGPDGTFTQVNKDGPKSVNITGTYTFSGNTVNLQATSFQLKGFPEAAKKDMEAHLQSTMGEKAQETVDFTGPDRIDVHKGNFTETFDRQK